MKILLIIILLSSCAHRFRRGTVAMKTGDETAHICLGHNDVAVGDKINFLKNDCEGSGIGGGHDSGAVKECEMKEIGTGTVSRLLNSHYSVVKTDGSFKLTEGTLVQRD